MRDELSGRSWKLHLGINPRRGESRDGISANMEQTSICFVASGISFLPNWQKNYILLLAASASGEGERHYRAR